MENIKYPIRLEVLTPLSVGAGGDKDWVKGIDYVQKENKVYVIDSGKLAACGVDVDRLTQLFMKADEQGICQFLGTKIEECSTYVFSSPVRCDNNIKTFLRTQFYNKPLVAGSSIKGSVRSALFHHLRTDEQDNVQVFGKLKDGTDFMRFVQISDVEMPATSLVNTKIFNLRSEDGVWHGGWKHGQSRTDGHFHPTGFNTLYECVVPGENGCGSIVMAGKAFELLNRYGQSAMPYVNKKRDLLSGGIRRLFHVINDVTKGYLTKERSFFEKYQAERTEELTDCIDRLLSLIPTDDSYCLLKMSAGVGFHSITGDWRFDDYDETGTWRGGRNDGKKKYKSRKTAEYNGELSLMGFVKISLLDSDEAADAAGALQQDHRTRSDAAMAQIVQKEAAEQRKTEEKLHREMLAEEERKKQETFERLMSEARRLLKEEKWDEAMACALKASELCPESEEASQTINDCMAQKAVAEFRLKEQQEGEQRFSRPLSEVIQNAGSLGNLVGTTVKWLKADGHVFGDAERVAFVAKASSLSPAEVKKQKGKLNDLAKIAGQDVVSEIKRALGLE